MAYQSYFAHDLDELQALLSEHQELMNELRRELEKAKPPELYLNSFTTAKLSAAALKENLKACTSQISKGARLLQIARTAHARAKKKGTK